MSAQPNPLHVISDNGKSTPDGIKRELAGYLAAHSTPAFTATIDHVTGSRIILTAPSTSDLVQLVQATLVPIKVH
ncbi:MAG TPA: hypothetical protein DIS69_03835 [Moraxellaceae bacterium]|nr:hypothetical protein [Moraxellaceae bacterium]